MPIKVDNVEKYKAQIAQNTPAALDAMGDVGVLITQEAIMGQYGRPIWKTGALHNDVQKANRTENSIEVGNTLHYSLFVHEGTYKMAARPYMRDGLTTEMAARRIAAAALKELKKNID